MGPERVAKQRKAPSHRPDATFKKNIDATVVHFLLNSVSNGRISSGGRFDRSVWNDVVRELQAIGYTCNVRQAQNRLNRVALRFILKT